jgi:hypothetical protein
LPLGASALSSPGAPAADAFASAPFRDEPNADSDTSRPRRYCAASSR